MFKYLWTMNPNKKLHQQSPFTKCKTKRLNSEQKKTIKGTFIAEVNIQDVCDETSEEGSWITESDTSKTMEAEEEIYSSTETFRRSEKQQDDAWSLSHMREESIASPTKAAVDDILPSPKRCSRSDSDETSKASDRPAGSKIHPVSPYIEEMKDFSSMLSFDETNRTVIEYHHETRKESKSPQTGSERHSNRIFDSTRIVDPEIGTILPARFEWCDLSSISSSTQSSQHDCTKKLKSSEKRTLSKESMPKVKRKKLFTTVKPDASKKTTTEEVPSSFSKEPLNLHSAIQSKNLTKTLLQDNTDNLCDTPKSSAVHKLPKRDIFLRGKSRLKTIEEEITSKFGPLEKDSLKKSFSGKHISQPPESLGRTYIIETKESVRTPLLNISTENAGKSAGATFILSKDGNQSKKSKESELLERTKLHETIKASNDLLKEKRLSAVNFSIPTGSIIPSESVENNKISLTKTSKRNEAKSPEEILESNGNQSKKTTAEKLLKRRKKHLYQTNPSGSSPKGKSILATEDIIPTETVESSRAPSTKISKENETKSAEATFILSKDGNQSRKAKESKLLKRKKLYKAKASHDLLKEKSLSAAPLSLAPVDIIPTETVESSRAPSSKISEENKAKSTEGPAALIKDSYNVEKSSTAWKNNLHRRKEKSLKEKQISTGTSSISTRDSIMDFIVPTYHEESIEKNSSKISEGNSKVGTDLNDTEDPWKLYAASTTVKRKETCFKIQEPLEKESVEETASTPSSTTINEDSVDYMDTSEREKSNASLKTSENSTEKFLEEMGLYESEQYMEAEPSKLKKRKKNLKKRKFRKDSSEEKSLEVRLQEYKDYLKTIPICDLSLKKWRDKKEKHGV